MTREDIEKAAMEYSELSDDSKDPDSRLRGALCIAFKDGVNWRINSVWHDRTEQADTSKELMLMYSNRSCRITQLNLTWDGFLSVDMFIKWAYIEDLIPNTEE